MPESRLVPNDVAGAETLDIMAAAPRYNAWQYDAIAPYVGKRVLEVGSGTGNMSEHIIDGGAEHVVLTDTDAWYRERLTFRFGHRPGIRVDALRLPDALAGERFRNDRIDTIVALNVVEHIDADAAALRTMREILVPAGRIVILVPALEALYGEMDRELGHFRRYTRKSLTDLFQRSGFRVERMFWFNRAGVPGWWFNGRVRKVKRIPVEQLKKFDVLVPLFRLERFFPLPFGQSLVAIGAPA